VCRLPLTCHCARCEVKFLAFPIRALCSRARLGLGGRETRRVRSYAPRGLPRGGRAANFYQKKMNTGVSAGTAITTTDGRRSKARPNEGGSRREREDPDGILFSTPAVAGRGRGSVKDALRACLRACLRATDARNRTANARAASCSAWGPCFACMGQQVIMVDGRWSL
jgi:hypothetical protein